MLLFETLSRVAPEFVDASTSKIDRFSIVIIYMNDVHELANHSHVIENLSETSHEGNLFPGEMVLRRQSNSSTDATTAGFRIHMEYHTNA